MYDQLNEYVQTFLNKLLSGFHKAQSAQHAFFTLFQKSQKELHSPGIIEMILRDLSEGYDCLSHVLTIAKLEAYGLDTNSLILFLIT